MMEKFIFGMFSIVFAVMFLVNQDYSVVSSVFLFMSLLCLTFIIVKE